MSAKPKPWSTSVFRAAMDYVGEIDRTLHLSMQGFQHLSNIPAWLEAHLHAESGT